MCVTDCVCWFAYNIACEFVRNYTFSSLSRCTDEEWKFFAVTEDIEDINIMHIVAES